MVDKVAAVGIVGLLATMTGFARAGIIGPGAATVAVAPPGAATAIVRTENYDPNPQYSFSYSVADGLTGDNKAQEETRNGDVVQGSYSLIEPDGSRRIVSYAADPINGFNAVVQKDPSISVKTTAALLAPVGAPVATAVRPTLVASPLIARPATLAVRSQPQIITGPALAAATNVVAANTGVLGLGLGLGLRSGSLYGSQALLTGTYGTGGIVKAYSKSGGTFNP